jgi:hypothetical protein
VLTEEALDRGDDEAGFFPVPQSPHGHAGEPACLGVGKSEYFLTIVRLLLAEINTRPPVLPGDGRPITYTLRQTQQ